MRTTLSVLTAACLMTLGQGSWADTADRDLQLRARTAALALPASDRASALQLLQQWHTQLAPVSPCTRSLALHRVAQATHSLLQQHFGSLAGSHLLAQPLLNGFGEPTHRPETTSSPVRLDLEPAMVQRWLAPWLLAQA